MIPVALSGVYDLLPIHTRHFYPCDLVLSVGTPIDTTGMTLRKAGELTTRLRSSIATMLGCPASEPASESGPETLEIMDLNGQEVINGGDK